MNLPTAALTWSSEYDSDLRSGPESGDGAGMGTRFTWRSVLWTALRGTYAFFREGSRLESAVKSVAWLVSSAVVLWGYHAFRREESSGATAVMELAGDYIVSVIAVAAVWVLGVFLWKLWMAPVRMIEDELKTFAAHLSDEREAAKTQRLSTDIHEKHGKDALARFGSQIERLEKRVEFMGNSVLPLSSRCHQALVAISEIDRLESTPEAIRSSISKAQLALTDLSKVEQSARDNERSVVGSFPRQWNDRLGICEGALHEIKSLCESAGEGSIDIDSSPNYDRNQFRKFDGDELFSDDETRQEFRKMSDRVETTIRQAETLRAGVAVRLDRAHEALRGFK